VKRKGCGVAQLVVHRLDVRQARVRLSARHPREVFPAQLTRLRGTSAKGGEFNVL
jgi:hypothetical protein